MGRVARWLAAVAGLALVAGVPVAAEAATRAKARVVVKKRGVAARRVVRRTVRPRVRAAVRVPVVAPPVIIPGPPVVARPGTYQPGYDQPAPGYEPAPSPAYAAYRWLDDAEAMLGATGLGAAGLGAGGQSAPDFRFEQGGDVHAAWLLSDGALIVADGAVDGLRLFFFPPDTAVPFLARTPDYSYGYDRGVLAVVYDADGRLGPDMRRDAIVAQSRFLYERGRTLWYAARAQPPIRSDARGYDARSQGVAGGAWLSFGGRGGWRDNGDWRAYRGGIGDDRRRLRDDRYRREREDRVARTARGGGYGNGGFGGGGFGRGGGYSGGRSDAGQPGRDDRRPGAPGGSRPDRTTVQAPPPAAYRPQPAAEAPPSSVAIDRGMAEPLREPPARRAERPAEPSAEAVPVRVEERVARPAPQPEERRREPEPQPVAVTAPEPAPAPAPAPRAAPPPEPAPPPQAAPEPERPAPRVRTAEPDTVEQPQ